MKKSIKLLIAFAITFLIAAVAFYFILPAINVYNQEFWVYLTGLIIVFGVIYFLVLGKDKLFSGNMHINLKSLGAGKIIIVLAAVPVLILIVGNVISSTFFNAQKYSTIIDVKEAVFEEDMPESGIVSNIALMDSASANIIGNRTLGALSEVVSQYQVNGTYYQINYKRTPQKL